MILTCISVAKPMLVDRDRDWLAARCSLVTSASSSLNFDFWELERMKNWDTTCVHDPKSLSFVKKQIKFNYSFTVSVSLSLIHI